MTRASARALRCGALVTAMLLGARTSRADHPRVVLVVDACAGLDQKEVERIASVELGALLVAEDGGAETTRVRVKCEMGTLRLRVDDPITRKSLERAIDPSAQPPKARARFVALAVAEAVTASWTELEANPEPKVAPMGPPPSVAAKRAAREVVRARVATPIEPRATATPTPPLRFIAAFTTRTYPTHTGLLVGGALRVAQDRELVAWSLDASADHGSRAYSQGRIETSTLGLAPTLFLKRSTSSLVLRGGVGARGGVALHVGAAPSDGVTPATVAGPFLGPVGVISVTAAPVRPLLLELTLEGGYVAMPVGALVDGARVVAVDGGWVGASLGLGFFP